VQRHFPAASTSDSLTEALADETIDAVIVATNPATQALGDAAATGTVAFASRRDHKHAMPALSVAIPLIESGVGAVGTATPSSREDHIHPTTGASSTIHEVVMQSGTSSPPVPIWNSAGDDYVYSS
jgi:hypothetical protein